MSFRPVLDVRDKYDYEDVFCATMQLAPSGVALDTIELKFCANRRFETAEVADSAVDLIAAMAVKSFSKPPISVGYTVTYGGFTEETDDEEAPRPLVFIDTEHGLVCAKYAGGRSGIEIQGFAFNKTQLVIAEDSRIPGQPECAYFTHLSEEDVETLRGLCESITCKCSGGTPAVSGPPALSRSVSTRLQPPVEDDSDGDFDLGRHPSPAYHCSSPVFFSPSSPVYCPSPTRTAKAVAAPVVSKPAAAVRPPVSFKCDLPPYYDSDAEDISPSSPVYEHDTRGATTPATAAPTLPPKKHAAPPMDVPARKRPNRGKKQ